MTSMTYMGRWGGALGSSLVSLSGSFSRYCRMVNLQNIQVKSGSNFTTICPFPVGYIYMSSTSTSPASVFGGTWSAITDGRIWRPWGSWNKTAGSDTHTLTVNEMPSHRHIGVEGSYGVEASENLNSGNVFGTRYSASETGGLLSIGTDRGSVVNTGGGRHTASQIHIGLAIAGIAQPNLQGRW